MTILNWFLNNPNSDPNSQLYQEVQNHLTRVQDQLQSTNISDPAQRSVSVSPPSSPVTAQSNLLSSSSIPAAPIPLFLVAHFLSNGAAPPSSSVQIIPVANPTLQSLDPRAYPDIVPPAITAPESNHLQPERPVLDDLVADGPFHSQERADSDPDFQANATLPLSQLIARAESPVREQSLDECDGPLRPACRQQTSSDAGLGCASQDERPDPELQALAAFPLSQLLAAGSGTGAGAGAASQWGTASQEGPDPELLHLAAQPLFQLLRAGADAQEENRHPTQASTASTTARSVGSAVGKALAPAKFKRPRKPHPPNGPTPSQVEHTKAEGFSPEPVGRRLRARPVSPSTSAPRITRRAVQTSAHAVDKQTQKQKQKQKQKNLPKAVQKTRKPLGFSTRAHTAESGSSSDSDAGSGQESDASRESSPSSRYLTAAESSPDKINSGTGAAAPPPVSPPRKICMICIYLLYFLFLL